MSAPELIYLQWYGDVPEGMDTSDLEPDEGDVSWCLDRVFDADFEYVRKYKYDKLAEIVDAFLSLDDWSDDLIAPKELIERAKAARGAA